MQIDWISLLKAQQADFLQRIKKPKTADLSLLESQVKGCHTEVMLSRGEALTKILEFAHQQAEILAKNPPATPPEYPENEDEYIPFAQYFQQQAEDYLVREQIVDLVITERLGKLVKKVPQDTLKNMVLDDEGNLRGESKFSYCLTNNPLVNIQVHVTDGESFNGIKKDKIKWSISQEDLTKYKVLIFLCLFYPNTTRLGYEKQTIIAGFLPTEQLEFPEPKYQITASSLLYAGGLNWYLESLGNQQGKNAVKNERIIIETAQTLPPDHPQKNIIGDWECWQTLKGHTRGINCLAFSSQVLITNGSRLQSSQNLPILASGSRGETKLWDLTKGELIETLSEYPWVISGLVDEVNSLVFSADGKTLVSAGADSTIKIWHTGALDLIDILHKHNGGVRCLAFTPDSKMLATGGDDRRILFWNLCDRQVKATLSLDDSAAHSLVFSSDGNTLIIGSYRKIKVYRNYHNGQENIQNFTLLHTLTGHAHIVGSLAISADNKMLISGSRDKTVKIWDLETGVLIRTLTGHREGVNAIALSPSEQIIASGSADQTIKMWHLPTGESLATFTGHVNTVTALAFTTSGDMLVSSSLDKTIKIWQRS
ncbi:MAG TPA: WD40 repeat domain-containing protein [Nostocaceae cyanobacterium]|nr:WD40 repeat domain-containing protein [Nostocaceae cyanobacterium]